MKINQLTGATFFVSGAIIFGLMHLAITIYLPTLAGVAGDPIGLPGLLDYTRGWIPYILSIVLMIGGLSLLVFGKENTKK